MNTDQKRVARRALGLPNVSARTSQNGLLTIPRTSDWLLFGTLVADHLAVVRYLPNGASLFSLTGSGARQALLSGESLSTTDFP